MAKILGWYEKRPGKNQVRWAKIFCDCGWKTSKSELGTAEHKVVVIEARDDYDDGEEVLSQHLQIELTASEAHGLVRQLLEAVECMENDKT